jgi:hypothetical protein
VLRAAVLSWMPIYTLSGCTTTMGSSATDGPAGLPEVSSVACAAFQPITWSSRDTDPTIRQVKAHNASFATLCPPPTGK